MKRISLRKKILGIVVLGVVLVIFFLGAPLDFPESAVVKIEPGSTLRKISLELKEKNIIRSSVLFESMVILFGREKGVVSTVYFFERKLPLYSIVKRIAKGEHNLAPISVTIPEGFTNEEIADAFARVLPDFNKANFLALASSSQGYLFPDTYFFQAADTEKEVFNYLKSNFNKKAAPVVALGVEMGKKEMDILTMASIVEKEAKGDIDRGIIAGILWKRLAINMPLQVDVALETYKKRGLPAKPIANPGLEDLRATINPEPTSYLYYLHDKTGKVYYAKTLAEHNRNIDLYLRKQQP